MISVNCDTCRRPIGVTTHITHGYLGTYRECEWCFEGKPRPAEPELITDTFTRPNEPARQATGARLDRIIDKLMGE